MSSTSFTHDVIVLGRGLAGVVLSETLALQGKRVFVVDALQAGQASAVAAGMVNPVVLRRAVLSWRASEMLAIAGAFYRDLQLRYDSTFWHPTPLAALFPTAQEAGIFQLRMKDAEVAPFLGNGTVNDPALAKMAQPYGHGEVKRSAWLDVVALLDKHRTRWIAAGDLEERKVEADDILRSAEGVSLFGRSAPLLVHCTGPFATLPGLVPVRGEGLTVRIPGLDLRCMVHRGVFIIPLGEDVYKVGSTFAWDDVWSGPTEEAQRHLLDRLGRVTTLPVEVVGHWAGVRPTSKDRRPILGRIAPHEAVLNGLGARGVLLSPWCAQQLCEHLFEGAPLDQEVDLRRFAIQ